MLIESGFFLLKTCSPNDLAHARSPISPLIRGSSQTLALTTVTYCFQCSLLSPPHNLSHPRSSLSRVSQLLLLLSPLPTTSSAIGTITCIFHCRSKLLLSPPPIASTATNACYFRYYCHLLLLLLPPPSSICYAQSPFSCHPSITTAAAATHCFHHYHHRPLLSLTSRCHHLFLTTLSSSMRISTFSIGYFIQ